MISLENIKKEKKTFRSGGKYKPTVHEILRYLSQKKNVSMAKLMENMIINEYKKLLGNEDTNNG